MFVERDAITVTLADGRALPVPPMFVSPQVIVPKSTYVAPAAPTCDPPPPPAASEVPASSS